MLNNSENYSREPSSTEDVAYPVVILELGVDLFTAGDLRRPNQGMVIRGKARLKRIQTTCSSLSLRARVNSCL